MEKDDKLPENQNEREVDLDEVQPEAELPEEHPGVASEKEIESARDGAESASKDNIEDEPTGIPAQEETQVDNSEDNLPERPQQSADISEEKPEAGKASTEDESNSSDDDEDDSDEEERLLDALEFDGPEKEELLNALKKFSSVENMRVLDKALREIKSHYDKLFQQEAERALIDFKEQGNDEVDFDYKGDEIDHRFFALYETLRTKKQKYFAQLEKSKDENLKRKNELLEQLRELVDGEESTTSINALKQLQAEWRKLGPVPGQFAKSLWANYNALLDRFYDHRSIYFELKELDRKKNLEAKLELCDRAEALNNLENIKDAIFQLNELHEEFKHIGPVPKEEQEPLWQRFKGASDKIYAKRKEFFEGLKKEFIVNLNQKQELGDRAAAFAVFQSGQISDWNKKTKEILELQKKWDTIGGLPREKAKEINKHFWGNFKQFFANKNAFFKTLEGQREENLKKKLELLEKAESIKDSDDWNQTAEVLKKLQAQWREIGPVPEKQRNDVYQKFKTACDRFFERRRSQGTSQNKEFDENQKRKEEICSMLEAYLNSDTIELDQVYDLLEQYAEVGFVPRNAIKKIHDRYDKITNELLSLEELTEEQLAELKMQVQLSKLKNSPHGNQKIHRKEGAIKRKISALENDISTWKTNVQFFADSKNANQLRDDFNAKIQNAEQELEELRKQLDVLNQA